MNIYASEYIFDDGLMIQKNDIDNVVNSTLKAIYDELPENIRRIDVAHAIIKECEKKLFSKKFCI